MRAAERPGFGECQIGARGGRERRGRIEQPGKGRDQPLNGGGVDLTGTPEAVKDLGAGGPRAGIPLVVDQLQVADPAAVPVRPLDLPEEHVPDNITVSPAQNAVTP